MSEILRPQIRCIPFRFNVSKHSTSNLSVSFSANFQNQSERRFATSSCLRTKFNLARSRLADPFRFFECCRLAFLIAFSDCFRNCGDSIFEPSDTVRNVFKPKSNKSDFTRLEFDNWLPAVVYHHDHEQLTQGSALNCQGFDGSLNLSGVPILIHPTANLDAIPA